MYHSQSVPTHARSASQPGRGTASIKRTVQVALGACVLVALGACGGVSNLTKERVAQSETSVQQARQTIGNSEEGAVELQKATQKMDAAKSALGKGQEQQAERSATQAHLHAELAVAKAQSSDARKGADDVLAGLDTLRDEAARGTSSMR